MSFQPSEFSLDVRYRRPGRGCHPQVDVPGWYLTVGYANEGLAQRYAENALLGAGEFLAIIGFVADVLPARDADALRTTAVNIAEAGEAEARRQLEAAEAQLESLTATVERLRGAVTPS